MTRKLLRLLSDPAVANALVANGRKTVEALNMARHVEDVSRVYDKLLATNLSDSISRNY